jgi:hypothetical protein
MHGRLAFVPLAAEVGDIVSVLYGSEMPHLLRPRNDGRFEVIGECYVDGIMHGEAMSSMSRLKDIVLA